MTRPLLFLRIIVGIILTITVNLCSVPAHATECFPDWQSVIKAHPGYHAAYHTVGGRKCWYADYKISRQLRQGGHTARPESEPMRDALANHLLEIGRMMSLPDPAAKAALLEYGRKLAEQREGR